MARTYVVKRGDTLRKIAKSQLGDGALFARIAELQRLRLDCRIRTYGGCFNFRAKRSGSKLSTHAWGIAIDLNPETNAMGREGDMAPGIVKVFESFGFTWGGRWTGAGKDRMHFQFCSGH